MWQIVLIPFWGMSLGKEGISGQGFMRPLVNTRTLGEKSFMYDLVRENKA